PQLALRESRGLVKSLPFLRDEFLVRRDDVLPSLERPELQLSRRVGPADDLDDDGDFAVVEDGVRIGRDRNVPGIPLLLRVAHRRGDETQRTSRGRIDATRAIREHARDRGADGAEAEQADAERSSAHCGRPHTTSATSSARTRVRALRAKIARASRAKSSARSPNVIRDKALVLASIVM